jgi:RNA polymerase sigma factor (sigma-70 family)
MELGERLADDLDGAFLDLVTEHQDLVYGVALRVVRRPADAEEVAQDAFVRAYRALSRYPRDRLLTLKLRPWLARIAVNVGRNQLRGRRDAVDIDQATLATTGDSDGPVELAERREERQLWTRLLSTLPERYRLAVALRHVDGLSYAELAEALGRPVGSVKSDVHRGVSLLRRAYQLEELRIEKREAV